MIELLTWEDTFALTTALHPATLPIVLNAKREGRVEALLEAAVHEWADPDERITLLRYQALRRPRRYTLRHWSGGSDGRLWG